MSRLVTTLAIFPVFIALIGIPAVQAQELIFVDDDASGADDGSSWSDAYPNLQDALATATDDDVVAVAAGTYYPDIGDGIPVDDRETSFRITGAQNGLEVYGGYAGDEDISLSNLKLSDRDFETNETTLSGDVDDTPNDMSGNSFHLFYLDGTTGGDIKSGTRVDGFTVTLGNANGSSSENNAGGGGLFCDGAGEGNECSPTLANMVFTDNQAEVGGAIYNYGHDGESGPKIINSEFSHNASEGGFNDNGGAIYNYYSSTVVKNTSFIENNAVYGGAIYNDGNEEIISSIKKSTFSGNTAENNGGAIYSEGSFGPISLTIVKSTFTENEASDTGGAILTDFCNLTVAETTFTGNEASDDGGAIYGSNDVLTVVGTTFYGNSADATDDGLGGAIYVSNDESTIANAAFSGNSSSLYGGALFVSESNPTVVSVTFFGNTADEGGGAIYNGGNFGEGSSPTITNSIFYDNSGAGNGDQIFNEGENSEPTVSYSLVEGGCGNIPGTICGDGNLTGDPQFADADGPDDTPGTEDDDLRLEGPGSENGPSPAIDAADNTAVPDTLYEDVTGEMSRFYDVEEVEDTGNGTAPIVDMGAYESDGSRLPVELAGFEAQMDEDRVRLTWQTASETGNARFEIQRKAGGQNSWRRVGAVQGAGTTTEAQRYQFTDRNVPYAADRLDYRLRQVDLDGSAQLSKTLTVERGVNEVEFLGTYPNPAQSRATVRYALPERQEVRLELYDVLGRQVRTLVRGEQAGRHERRVEVGDLASGVYFLRLEAEDKMRTQKLKVVR